MFRRAVTAAAFALLGLSAVFAKGIDPTAGERRPIDLVICLDTSGSMTELLDSARGKLWDIVNELAKARPTPVLRVGLLTYGSPNLASAAEGYVVRQIDLTGDLDSVYSKMMAMTTNGGDEYVGWVLNDAISTMSWSSDPKALKLIFVAGNESADQAAEKFNFRVVCADAHRKDIIVNSIYAGDRSVGVNEKWEELGRHGGGTFQHIDPVKGTIQISTPQDLVLERLNIELNATYVPYGAQGAAGRANQVAQDGNAERMGAQSCNSRVVAKGSVLYGNAAWDLVDACAEKKVVVGELKADDLPENMRKMTPGERQAYIDGMKASRAAVQHKIAEASAAREKFIQEEMKKRHDGGTSLDEALLGALRDQAARKGFSFSK